MHVIDVCNLLLYIYKCFGLASGFRTFDPIYFNLLNWSFTQKILILTRTLIFWLLCLVTPYSKYMPFTIDCHCLCQSASLDILSFLNGNMLPSVLCVQDYTQYRCTGCTENYMVLLMRLIVVGMNEFLSFIVLLLGMYNQMSATCEQWVTMINLIIW